MGTLFIVGGPRLGVNGWVSVEIGKIYTRQALDPYVSLRGCKEVASWGDGVSFEKKAGDVRRLRALSLLT